MTKTEELLSERKQKLLLELNDLTAELLHLKELVDTKQEQISQIQQEVDYINSILK